MGIRTVSSKESLESVREELIYSHVRLANHPDTKDLAPIFTDLGKELAQVQVGDTELGDKLILAHAGIDQIDERIDDLMTELAGTLRIAERRGRKTGRFERYFKVMPGKLAQLTLRPQLGRMHEWPRM